MFYVQLSNNKITSRYMLFNNKDVKSHSSVSSRQCFIYKCMIKSMQWDWLKAVEANLKWLNAISII